jgi:hypothetical protein
MPPRSISANLPIWWRYFVRRRPGAGRFLPFCIVPVYRCGEARRGPNRVGRQIACENKGYGPNHGCMTVAYTWRPLRAPARNKGRKYGQLPLLIQCPLPDIQLSEFSCLFVDMTFTVMLLIAAWNGRTTFNVLPSTFYFLSFGFRVLWQRQRQGLVARYKSRTQNVERFQRGWAPECKR